MFLVTGPQCSQFEVHVFLFFRAAIVERSPKEVIDDGSDLARAVHVDVVAAGQRLVDKVGVIIAHHLDQPRGNVLGHVERRIGGLWMGLYFLY